MNESSAIALVLLTSGAIVGTYLWRGAGVMFAARIKSDSPVFQWVTFVSYAMLGGLIARMVILPIGPLMETPLLFRVLAFVIGWECSLVAAKGFCPQFLWVSQRSFFSCHFSNSERCVAIRQY